MEKIFFKSLVFTLFYFIFAGDKILVRIKTLKMKNNPLSKFRTLDALTKHFSDGQKCIDFLAEQRWHGKPVCPYCDCTTVYHRKDGRYACKDCKSTFSVFVGTIFQNTKLKLLQWFQAIYLIVNNKQGISSMQLAREIEVSQSTAWHILHKIRILLRDEEDDFPDTVHGEKVDVNNGSGRPLVIRQLTEPLKLHPKILPFVQPGSRIFTDDYICYQTLAESELEKYNVEEPHGMRRDPITETPANKGIANGLWLQVKRMVTGIYHFVSAAMFHRYVYEAMFRRRTCRCNNAQRFERAMGRVEQVIPYYVVSP